MKPIKKYEKWLQGRRKLPAGAVPLESFNRAVCQILEIMIIISVIILILVVVLLAVQTSNQISDNGSFTLNPDTDTLNDYHYSHTNIITTWHGNNCQAHIESIKRRNPFLFRYRTRQDKSQISDEEFQEQIFHRTNDSDDMRYLPRVDFNDGL